MQLTGLIVCGGTSERMGTDKATLRIEGERLVDRLATRLATVADPVLIAPGRGGRLGPLPWAEVDDLIADAGPAAGIIAAMAASPHQRLAVVAVDHPLADVGLLVDLAHRWSGEVALVPVTDGRRQWLHAVWGTNHHDALAERLKAGARSLWDLTDGLDVKEVAIAPPADTAFATNVNHPGDLAGLGFD